MTAEQLLAIARAARDGDALNGEEAHALHTLLTEITLAYVALVHGELEGSAKTPADDLVYQLATAAAANL